MLLPRFSSLRNAGNGVLEGKTGNLFWGRGGGYGSGLAPEKRSRPSLSIGDGGYVNSVQPPLSEIPGSAPEETVIW